MSNPGSGRLGFGIVGGRGVEHQMFGNRVTQGMLAGAPTTGSTQVTGTGASDFNADIAAGIIAVGGVIKEYAVQADFDVASSAAQQMAAGESRVYSIVGYLSKSDGVIRLKSVAGAAVTTGTQVAATDAAIEADLAVGTFWFRICNVTVNRTADTTVTQSQNNAVRPSLVPVRT